MVYSPRGLTDAIRFTGWTGRSTIYVIRGEIEPYEQWYARAWGVHLSISAVHGEHMSIVAEKISDRGRGIGAGEEN